MKILEESGVTPDSVVLEVGSGNGFFTEVLAARAKKVYAVELQKGMVDRLVERVRRFGDKIDIIAADMATYDMGEEVADVCLMYYSFHEVSSKDDAAWNISRAVKTKGLLSIYEPTVEVDRRAMEKTIAAFEALGFVREVSRHGLFTRYARLRKMHI
ncbi:MAG TPA: class I SAM-dependent methyltransferase [Thermodesulfovibrionales bacterium]|nr:class I SAM-dependent methyltransferase [Thermodesulfovibrionales bacterium]